MERSLDGVEDHFINYLFLYFQTELRHKYEVVKKIVEQRYNRIRIMEQEKVELTQRRTCVKCSAPLSSLQVPQ